jgi:hypothetical protein
MRYLNIYIGLYYSYSIDKYSLSTNIRTLIREDKYRYTTTFKLYSRDKLLIIIDILRLRFI